MPKILSELKKKEMLEAFKNGTSIEDLEVRYGLKRLTITKHLKSLIDLKEFKKLTELNSSKNNKNSLKGEQFNNSLNNICNSKDENLSRAIDQKHKKIQIKDLSSNDESFFEIPPLNEEFDFNSRKDLTSKPLEEFALPGNIFMIVDNNIELNILTMRDFPEFSFLPESDQKRKILKLFSNKKTANTFCGKNQKVIKVPNSNIFNLASKYLLQKGISRVIFDDYLLSI